jgi:peptide/nickel transport system permease protein
MKLISSFILPLIVAALAAIAATLIIYQLLAAAPGMLPVNAQAKPASYPEWLFGSYGTRGVVNGDYGQSLAQRRPVYELLQERLPASLELFIPAVWQSLLFGIPLGVLLAYLRRRGTDGFLRPLVWLGLSIPTFWLAIQLILIFGVQQRTFPIAGRCPTTLSGGCTADIEHLTLPLRTLVIHWTCIVALFIRTALLPFLQQDPDGRLKARYWIDGVLTPTLVLIPGFFAGVASTQVLVETVFAWPGIGRLTVDSVMRRDFPVLAASVTQVVLWFIAVFFVVTLLNGIVQLFRGDPSKAKNQPKPQTEGFAPEPVGLFDEPETSAPSTSIRTTIDRLYTGLAVAAVITFLGIVLVVSQPVLVTSSDPFQTNPDLRLLPPGDPDHTLGTDELGRDIMARLLVGGQNTLGIAFQGALIALVIGGIVGFVGGLFVDTIGVFLNIPVNAVIIGLNLLPTLPLLLLAIGIFGPVESRLPLYLGLLTWGTIAITVRTKTAAALKGTAGSRSLAGWLLVPVYALALTTATLIVLEASLSFLGVGVQAPSASWGSLIAGGMRTLAQGDNEIVAPGLLMVATVFCLTIIYNRVQDSNGFLPPTAAK